MDENSPQGSALVFNDPYIAEIRDDDLVSVRWLYDMHQLMTALFIYRMSQEEWTKLRESVPYVKISQYNPKHLYAKLNGYGDNGQRSLKL